MADIDLDSLSRADLAKLRADVDRAIAGAATRERRAAREAAEAAAREHGFSLAELTGGASPGRAAGAKRAGRSGTSDSSSPAPSEAKYRNPENPEQTWSGRGRRPQWVHEATANGRALEELAIQ